jgi:hypothetical protein
MLVNVKLTDSQLYLIQMYIIDLCNVRFKSKIEDYTKMMSYDECDQYRIRIYHKLKGNIIEGCHIDEIKFLIKEIEYWIFSFDREKSEKISGRSLWTKLKKLLQKDIVRDQKLKILLG